MKRPSVEILELFEPFGLTLEQFLNSSFPMEELDVLMQQEGFAKLRELRILYRSFRPKASSDRLLSAFKTLFPLAMARGIRITYGVRYSPRGTLYHFRG